MKPFILGITEVIHDWLSIKENRERIPAFYCSESVFDFCANTFPFHHFDDGDVIFEIKNNLMKLVKDEKEHS